MANYKIACLKLPHAETHADPQTAVEVDDTPRRKRKRLVGDDSPSVKGNGTLSPAPKMRGPGCNGRSTAQRRAPSLASGSPTVEGPEPQQYPPGMSPEQTQTATCPLNSTQALLRRLLANQEIIMDQLKVLQMTVQKIQGGAVSGQEALESDVFPLRDVSALLAVEKRLGEDADLKNKMITALSVIGGMDTKDAVWRLMKHCFTNTLAKRLNWRGINGKMPFHKLQLKYVLTGTVRKNPLTSTATDQEVEAFIKRWLHLAVDRDGGRRERERRRALDFTRPLEEEPDEI